MYPIQEIGIISIGLMSNLWILLIAFAAWKTLQPTRFIPTYIEVNKRARGHRLNPYKDLSHRELFRYAVNKLKAHDAREVCYVDHDVAFARPMDQECISARFDSGPYERVEEEVVQLESVQINNPQGHSRIMIGYGPRSKLLFIQRRI